MQLEIEVKGVRFAVKNTPIPLAIPLDFKGQQPNFFGVQDANSSHYESGSFVGSIELGGKINVNTVTLTPHCNGTHTETIQHITENSINISDIRAPLMLANLISVELTPYENTNDQYHAAEEDDLVIDSASLRAAFDSMENFPIDALVIRTLPNPLEKCFTRYQDCMPPYFTSDAMKLLCNIGIKHLIVDLPSVDRMIDKGKLTNHRLFWGVAEASTHISFESNAEFTITEFAYIKSDITDGIYLLNLGTANYCEDAAPSNPQLFKLKRL